MIHRERGDRRRVERWIWRAGGEVGDDGRMEEAR